MGASSELVALRPTPVFTRRQLGFAVVGVWALVVLGVASQNYATYAVKREALPFWVSLLWGFNDWIGWLFLAPLVFWLARRFPVERPQAGRHLAVHVLFGAATAMLHGFIYFLMEWWTGELDDASLSLGQLSVLYTAKNLVFGVLVYGSLVSLSHGIEYYRRYKERELRATQLLAQLSRAELEVLKMQLQPHFLFNTLHAISALLRPDPDAADRIITRLGDLLRMSLQSNGAQEVPLAQELEFVEKYADIQRTRFRDRLSIRVTAEPGVEDALVPSLILQPLVENSIRHGVERREESARIAVRAARRGDRLQLTVTDDGPGFPDEILTPVPGRGLGLANTRARVTALYGEDGRIEIGAARGGGATVTIDLPFRTTAGHHVA
ncbi:MAG TPA: histidine kinase [Gemmatimonadales bacterium]|nr:histidine kinase [Gemmatimonadales bacterium]